MQVKIALQEPLKLIRQISEVIERVVQDLIDRGVIDRADSPKALDAALAVTQEGLLSWRLSISGERAWVTIELKDDPAAREIMRNAAIEAVKLKA